MPAANSVIASAKRLIEVRQCCRSSSSTAEMSVPAWPMPIHQTKLAMAKPHATGMLMPQMPTPVDEQLGDREKKSEHQRRRRRRSPIQPTRGRRPREHDVGDLVGDARIAPAPRRAGARCRIRPSALRTSAVLRSLAGLGLRTRAR